MSRPPPTAVVVDDNAINRQLVTRVMQKLGWTAFAVADGQEALTLLGRERVDLVLLDLRMPGLSGEDVCRCIRAEPSLAGLVVVACTAHVGADERERVRAVGFDDLLTKPVSVGDLRRVCATVPGVAAVS